MCSTSLYHSGGGKSLLSDLRSTHSIPQSYTETERETLYPLYSTRHVLLEQCRRVLNHLLNPLSTHNQPSSGFTSVFFFRLALDALHDSPAQHSPHTDSVYLRCLSIVAGGIPYYLVQFELSNDPKQLLRAQLLHPRSAPAGVGQGTIL